MAVVCCLVAEQTANRTMSLNEAAECFGFRRDVLKLSLSYQFLGKQSRVYRRRVNLDLPSSVALSLTAFAFGFALRHQAALL
jgi:hypothetical protein